MTSVLTCGLAAHQLRSSVVVVGHLADRLRTVNGPGRRLVVADLHLRGAEGGAVEREDLLAERNGRVMAWIGSFSRRPAGLRMRLSGRGEYGHM